LQVQEWQPFFPPQAMNHPKYKPVDVESSFKYFLPSWSDALNYLWISQRPLVTLFLGFPQVKPCGKSQNTQEFIFESLSILRGTSPRYAPWVCERRFAPSLLSFLSNSLIFHIQWSGIYLLIWCYPLQCIFSGDIWTAK
jgi:hypothetical protein